MFGAYVKENRKALIALAVYTVVFALVFWLYRLPLGAAGYAALVCLFLLALWFAVDYRRFAARLRLLQRLEQEITLSTEQLPEPDGMLEAQYQALVRALDTDRRAQMTRSQRSYQDLVEYYTVWAHQIKTPLAAMRLLLQDAETDEQRALLEQLQSVEQYVEMVLGYLRLESTSSDYVIRNYALDDIVRQAVRKFASQFIRRKLRLEYAPLNVNVITDEKWLLFVIEQVLSNALKYTRSGSVSITLEEPKTLCIRDTGIGIAPEDLPLVLAGKAYPEMAARLAPIARQLGIAELLQKFPYELSGGQKQRVAVARALITQPKLVLADEPTGALDSRATDELLRLFEEINRGGQTILMVTHSVKAASHASRVLFIKDGEVFHEIYRGESTDEQLYQKISDTLTMLATGGEHHA